jgi:hypothetical protein
MSGQRAGDQVDTRIAELEAINSRPNRPTGRVAGIFLVVAVVALVAVLATTGGDPLPTATVFAHAVSETTASGTAHVSATATLVTQGSSLKIATIENDTDFHARGRATLKTSALQERILVVDGVTYLSIPGVTLSHGEHWLAITRADINDDPIAKSSAGSVDPTAGLQFLSAVDGNPQIVDDTTIGGVSVTHYRFTLNLRDFFDRIGKEAEALNSSTFAQGLKSLGGLVDLSAVPGEAWLDAQGHVRKFALSITTSQAGETVTVRDEFLFSRFGEAITVNAPAASDTGQFRENRDYFSKIAAAAKARAKTTTG